MDYYIYLLFVSLISLISWVFVLQNKIKNKDEEIKKLEVLHKELKFSHDSFYESAANVKQDETIKAQMRASGIRFINLKDEPWVVFNLHSEVGKCFANSKLIKKIVSDCLSCTKL